MRLHELFEKKVLLESSVTLTMVNSLDNLINPKTDKYYTEEVNVKRHVDLTAGSLKGLSKLPVKFGKVEGYFSCSTNKLTSLDGAPTEVGSDFYCSNNPIASLEGIHKIIKRIDGVFWYSDNKVVTGGIGLILIDGLKRFVTDETRNAPAFDIINKYLGQGKRGLLLCQDELIEAGFEEYAKL